MGQPGQKRLQKQLHQLLCPTVVQHGLGARASKLLGEGGPQGAQLWETNRAKPLVGTATATTTLQAQHRTPHPLASEALFIGLRVL